MTGNLTRPALDDALDLTLTDEQWAAVSATLDPAVVVAGAGSGKTTSMAARVAYLVGSGLARPDEVLGLTFTTKATAQLLGSMRRAVARLSAAGLAPAVEEDAPIGEPTVLTYHSFAARIIGEHGIRLGREPGAVLLADGLRHQLAYRVVCRSTLALSELRRSPIDLTSDVLAVDDELTELGIDPEDLKGFDDDLRIRLLGAAKPQNLTIEMADTSRHRSLLADLVLEWRAEKAGRDVVDFADQIRLAGELVTRFPEVVEDLRRRYGVVLLDEYQDTSIAQRVLLQTVFGEGHPVMAVGDPCQAIYGWRGASVDNIENFPRHFPPRDPMRPAARFTLSQNRRSGPRILEVANRASQQLRAVHAGVDALVPGDNGKGHGALSCALFDTYQHELEWLVGQVAATHAGGARWEEIAVLAATGKDLVNVDAALRRRGIPTQLVGAAALLAQPAVADLRSYLEVLHDPVANPAFVRLAVGPRWRIGARDLAALGTRAAEIAGGRHRSAQEDLASALDDAVAGADLVESVSLTEALDDLGDEGEYSPEAVERFGALAGEIAELRRHVGEPLAELVLRVMRVTGLEVEAGLAPQQIAAQQQHALQAFVDLAAEFTDLDGRLTLGAFLSRLRDAERFDVDPELDVSGPADAVQLLTVHKAKGLEFGYVFVPFVADGAFPGGRGRPAWPTSAKTVPWPLRQDATDALAGFPDGDPRATDYAAYKKVLRGLADLEDQRLAYVAFTRAERGLSVTGHWWGPTQTRRRGPDAFLSVVHEACEDGLGTIVHWEAAPADDAVNPQAERSAEARTWPADPDPAARALLVAAAEAVRSVSAVQPGLPMTGDGADADRARIQEWDDLAAALVEEARGRQLRERTVTLPAAVSASMLMRALEDPAAVAADLVRPMPQAPAPAARRGTAFHAWVEARYGQQSLLDPDDLPGAADADIGSEEELAALKEAFEKGPYAQRTPVAVEAPFSLLLGGRVVNGRIDAVFESEVEGMAFDIVDWKTGSARKVDPMQLALYRLAWARLADVPVEQVSAAFVIVGAGEVVRPDTSSEVARLSSLAEWSQRA